MNDVENEVKREPIFGFSEADSSSLYRYYNDGYDVQFFNFETLLKYV